MPSVSEICSNLPRDKRVACRRSTAGLLQRQWLQELVWGADQDSAWQVQIWLGVFPVNWRQLIDPDLLTQQMSTIRNNLKGTFGDLLGAMVLDPALQISLNGPANQQHNPNENLARELLELFSLGEGNYTETDVREAARALSGYKLNKSRQLQLDPRRHDPGMKTILGRTANFDGVSLASWLSEQPATARNISLRLWRRLVGPQPSAQRLGTLASGWRESNLSIPWLMKAIQSAPEAIESKRQGLRLTDPLEVTARSLRLLGSRHPDAVAIALRGLRSMGQMPFEPPSVKGWPVNEQWINLRRLQERRRTLQALLTDEEVWAGARLPTELSSNITPIKPLNISLPAKASRDNLALLFTDPVWQLA